MMAMPTMLSGPHRGGGRLRLLMFVTAVAPVSPLAAQGSAQGSVQGSAQAAASAGSLTANRCETLATMPSALTRAPEGLALLRLKRELEGAVEALERQQRLPRAEVRQLSTVQRGVDSAMQVVVRALREGWWGEEVMAEPQGDSLRTATRRRRIEARHRFLTGDSVMPPMGPALARTMVSVVDGLVRALQPQVAVFTGAAAQGPGVAAPAGYLGVSLSGAQLRLVTPEGVFTSHCEYPLIESVDIGSPAAAGGLAAGDTVLAYNGRDVLRQAVSYPSLLAPGSVVRVRVRRSGRTREVPVTVALRTTAPTAPPASPSPASLPPGSRSAVLAGAQFTTMDDDLATLLDLEAGVLVLRVPPGTPAAEAGLRAGAVVVQVNGQRVRDVAAFRRAIAAGGALRLLVQSRAGEQTVVLRGR